MTSFTLSITARPCLGLLGGAGPLAAAHFQRLFLEAWARYTGAWRDADFPRLVVDTGYLSGMDDSGLICLDRAGQALEEGARRLQAMGATALVVPCFSLHRVTPVQTCIPWISLKDLVLEAGQSISGPVVVLEATGRGAHGSGGLADAWQQRYGNVLGLTDDEHLLVQALIRLGMG